MEHPVHFPALSLSSQSFMLLNHAPICQPQKDPHSHRVVQVCPSLRSGVRLLRVIAGAGVGHQVRGASAVGSR